MGDYQTPKNEKNDDNKIDIYEIVALAKRLNITLDDLKEMSFVSLVNILYSAVKEKDSKEASQSDIDAFLR